MRQWWAALAAGVATLAWAQGAQQPPVDPGTYPNLTAMLATLRNGSDASRYCAQTGGLFLDADALLRKDMKEPQVVEAIVARGKGTLAPAELARLRQLAQGVTDLASGFRQLAPESAAVAYTQTCLASTRGTSGRSQADLDERYANALACDRSFKPGSLDGKECVARAFLYR